MLNNDKVLLFTQVDTLLKKWYIQRKETQHDYKL